jgi:hypothetical protein
VASYHSLSSPMPQTVKITSPTITTAVLQASPPSRLLSGVVPDALAPARASKYSPPAVQPKPRVVVRLTVTATQQQLLKAQSDTPLTRTRTLLCERSQPSNRHWWGKPLGALASALAWHIVDPSSTRKQSRSDRIVCTEVFVRKCQG